MKIGITAATGQLGKLVVESLKQKVASENIVVLVRTPEKASDLGVEAKAFDYSNKESQVEALKGIDTLLLISGSEVGQREAQHANVIASAKEAGVKKIVYTSVLHADTSTLSLAVEHIATEKNLKESGLTYTILRNGWYTENYAGSIGGALAGGAFIGSVGDGKISSAARIDFAEAAATVLATEGHDGKVYELAGDTSYTLTDLAAEISAQTGKTLPYANLPEAEYAKILTSFGLPEFLAQAIASWDVSASKGDLFDDSKTLSALIGRPTTPLAETVKETLASLS
ncbi:SDR family oxidoreductase [Flectobacillus sp. DC10W]|jgi:NAD(P)H dehydrogenase (quinone)|uniref:SDR family oxidoreductase n=1 Tax=Flectobacillus longus TaxID=2984207 RepID=A0ABT6YJS4_9BACT|nr:SDR family oxidoreductase [Flectobacillus longus]MDI9863842.1 SDR family oxidoreductase [Flectobacillus longus]